MPPRTNEFGQPIGEAVEDWIPCPHPGHVGMQGKTCSLEPLSSARHAEALHEAYGDDPEGRNWTYLPYGPFASAQEYAAIVSTVEDGDDPVFYAVIDTATGKPIGVASYLRIAPDMGSIEVGHLSYSPRLQGTTAATEAMYLMMRRAFDELGYRRYEWKCDSLNGPSRAAAERLGFIYEGAFRQAVVAKGRSRDTAWFSITDKEWPRIKSALEAWLDPSNFDEAGRQRRSLADFRK
jgi:RimJ/RimL family protein N-acetyltransferase